MAVKYEKVVDLLTDVIKELNQPCVGATTPPAELSAGDAQAADAQAVHTASAAHSAAYMIRVECQYHVYNATGQLVSFSPGPTVQVSSTDSVNGAKGRVHNTTYVLPRDQELSLPPPLGAGGYNTPLTSTTQPLSKFVPRGRVLHMKLIQRLS
jgi:hypothetical protein